MSEQQKSLGRGQNKTKNISIYVLVIGILLFASNLRAPLTSVGPLVPMIRDSLGVSNSVVGIITTLPLLAFALVSPFAPMIAHRIGMERTIFFSLIILLFGIVMRSVTGVGTLFIGTAFIGIAIAFGNVLLPGFVSMSFPIKIGVMTGLYGVFMNIFAAIASGISVPISNIRNLGWQGSLGAWGMLTIVTILVWVPLRKKSIQPSTFEKNTEKKNTKMWTSFTAWQVTLFMGIQSLMFYTVMTWLPEILHGHGYSATEAGWLLSLMLIALIPFTFLMPIIADKVTNQSLLGAMIGGIFIIGVLGLLSGYKGFIIISSILFGLGCGGGFSLAMMLFSLRTKNGYDASSLSGMAQSFGYLLAALGPVVFGGLYDWTGSWIASLLMLFILSIISFISGWLSGRPVTINKSSDHPNVP